GTERERDAPMRHWRRRIEDGSMCECRACVLVVETVVEVERVAERGGGLRIHCKGRRRWRRWLPEAPHEISNGAGHLRFVGGVDEWTRIRNLDDVHPGRALTDLRFTFLEMLHQPGRQLRTGSTHGISLIALAPGMRLLGPSSLRVDGECRDLKFRVFR